MLHKRFTVFLILCAIFLYTGRNSIHAYRVIYGNNVLNINHGGVLGTTTVEYTYVVRAKPTAIPIVTQAPSATPVPPSMALIDIPAPTLTPTQTSSTGGGIHTQSLPDLATAQNNNNPVPTATPKPPTSTPIPLCGGITCYSSMICYENLCRARCSAASTCLGAYKCVSGACIPDYLTSSSSVAQAPTATPAFAPPHSSSSRSSVANTTSSSSSTRSANAPAGDQGPTNTPYPTRVPVNQTFYNNTGDTGTRPPQGPAPTPIPDALKGKTSTIVVEMPPPPPDPANPLALLPAPPPLILKGEDMTVIKIGASKTQEKPVSDTAVASAIRDLDISIEAKQGIGVEISQQQFVIQKGAHTVTISANEKKVGTLVLEQNQTKARITMGLSIDPSTNFLTVDTPNGPMRVSIMPEDALSIIRQLKVVDTNKPPSDMALETAGRQLQYHVKANKEQKLFGMVPLSIPRDVYVAADTGSLMAVKQTGLWNFITLFTF